VDFWKESFRYHSCWKIGHLKLKCPDSRDRTRLEGHHLSESDEAEFFGSGPFDRDTFLGKTLFFFPSFFRKLSSDEMDYLKNNESWVLDIFSDF
jgi:hypothetical protein